MGAEGSKKIGRDGPWIKVKRTMGLYYLKFYV